MHANNIATKQRKTRRRQNNSEIRFCEGLDLSKAVDMALRLYKAVWQGLIKRPGQLLGAYFIVCSGVLTVAFSESFNLKKSNQVLQHTEEEQSTYLHLVNWTEFASPAMQLNTQPFGCYLRNYNTYLPHAFASILYSVLILDWMAPKSA